MFRFVQAAHSDHSWRTKMKNGTAKFALITNIYKISVTTEKKNAKEGMF